MRTPKRQPGARPPPVSPGGGAAPSRRNIITIAGLLVVAATIVYVIRSEKDLRRSPGQSAAGLLGALGGVGDGAAVGPTTPSYYDLIHDREVVWQAPEQPKAAVFLAHGCRHKAPHFFNRSSTCVQCKGLPEDSALVHAALARNYAVLAVSSSGRCWDNSWPLPKEEGEVREIVAVISTWRKEHDLASKPLFALGASSGGYFVTILAHVLELEGIALLISAGVSMAMEKPLASGKRFPPTIFVHMPRDRKLAAKIARSVAVLQANSTSVAAVESLPQPVTEDFFTRHISGIDSATSAELQRALLAAGFLDDSGVPKADGRHSEWKKIAKKMPALKDDVGHLKFQVEIEEELNMAFAYHEMTAGNATQIMDWFDNVCRNDLGIVTDGRCTTTLAVGPASLNLPT